MQDDSRPLILPELTEYRARNAKRRAVAFLDIGERVLGIDCQPLTPRTFSMLYATGSRFIFGGTPGERDCKQFLWFHSAEWCDDSHPEAKARYRLALASFNKLLVGRRGWRLRRPTLDECAVTLALAGNDIAEIVSQAFADAPSGSGKPGKPVATLEAQLINEFATAYGWTPERTSGTALRRLFQLHRCIRSARGEDMDDEGEEEIKAAHYTRRNAAAMAAKANTQAQEAGT
jgi:hypothetical protein